MIWMRRSSARVFVAVALTTAAIVVPSSAAMAEHEDGHVCGIVCIDVGSAEERVEAGAEFGSGGSGTQVIPTGSSAFAGCVVDRVLAGEELLIARPDVASVNLTGSTFSVDHWVIYCPELSGFDAYTIFPVGDPPPSAIVTDMILDAYAQTPVVAFNPITSPDGDEDIMIITQMTTFLWVDEVAWNTSVSATATLPLPGAPFSVTTTATPRDAHWSGGETPISCSGADMRPYVFGIGGDDAQSSNCTMVYRQPSVGRDHTVQVEVEWDVVYSCSDGSCGGSLPDITTISTRPVVVGEIQAVGAPDPTP